METSLMATLHLPRNGRSPSICRAALITLLAFGAVSALLGGWYGMAGAKDVPLDWLNGTPFDSYFIPSLFLFAVVGGSLGLAAFLVVADRPTAQLGSKAAGVLLIGWILIQVAAIGWVSWLQGATLVAGMTIVILSEGLQRTET
jgi:hypothetical protein